MQEPGEEIDPRRLATQITEPCIDLRSMVDAVTGHVSEGLAYGRKHGCA